MALNELKRFSLRSAFIGIAIVALIIGSVFQTLRNWELKRELKILRLEAGHLVPRDLTRVNVIEVPTADRYSWRWRLYAPPGTTFDAGIITEDIPANGVPASTFRELELPSVSNGILISASVTRDLDAGYSLEIDFGNGIVIGDRTTKKREDLLDGSASLLTAGQNGTEVHDFEKPLILHRCRLFDDARSTPNGNPSEQSRGVMFWLIPKKP